MGYRLLISEEQRVALLAVIKAAGADRPDAPLEYWEGMLEELPKVEDEDPGTLHGFCL